MAVKYQSLIESSSAFRRLSSDAESGCVAASYVLVSPDLFALDLLSRLFVAKIVCGKTDGLMADRALDGSYIDMVFLPRTTEKSSGKLLAEDVDYLLSTAYVTPSELSHKYYLIKPESPMSELMQNKLLKTLEEPPALSRFLILAKTESELLPTVLSRSSIVRLEEFSENAIAAQLKNFVADEVTVNLAAASCRGQIGLADKMTTDKKYRHMIELAFTVLQYMKRSPDILHQAALIGAYKDNLAEFVDFLEIVLRDAMVYGSGAPQLIKCNTSAAQIREISKEFSPETVLKILPVFKRTRERIALNGNGNSIIDEMLFSILEVKAKCLK